MNSERFASMLDPFHTDLIKIIRGCPLEGLKSIKAQLDKLDIYSTYLIFVHAYLVLCCGLGVIL